MARKSRRRRSGLRLTMELVPLTAWGQGLRNRLKRSQWEKLRQEVFDKFKGKCAVCGASLRYFVCHEVWEYDDRDRIQKLRRLESLCWMCDRVKQHFGNTEMLIMEGAWKPSLLDRLVRHFMRVNDCDIETFEGHKAEAYEKWGERSTYEWKLDLGKYKRVVS
jgi:hypothetical protein